MVTVIFDVLLSCATRARRAASSGGRGRGLSGSEAGGSENNGSGETHLDFGIRKVEGLLLKGDCY